MTKNRPDIKSEEKPGEIELHRQAIMTAMRARSFYRLYVLGLMLVYVGLFYYFGEIVDYFGWTALRWQFFYSVHDVHRLLFFVPIVYAAYYFGIRASIIITIISLEIMLPRALFISPYPDPLARMVVTMAIGGVLGYLTGEVRQQAARTSRLEAQVRGERDQLRTMLERLEDGIMVTGPDYSVRYLNPSMTRDFGDGVGRYCYDYLHNLAIPCQQGCKLTDVLGGKVERWQYTFANGRTYEVVASPYVDADGTTCQLTTFRNITSRPPVIH